MSILWQQSTDRDTELTWFVQEQRPKHVMSKRSVHRKQSPTRVVWNTGLVKMIRHETAAKHITKQSKAIKTSNTSSCCWKHMQQPNKTVKPNLHPPLEETPRDISLSTKSTKVTWRKQAKDVQPEKMHLPYASSLEEIVRQQQSQWVPRWHDANKQKMSNQKRCISLMHHHGWKCVQTTNHKNCPK